MVSRPVCLCVFVCVSHLLKVVDQSAHKLSKDPAGQWVQCGSEGHTADQKQDVGRGQVYWKRTRAREIKFKTRHGEMHSKGKKVTV